jgi:hypothetical protein
MNYLEACSFIALCKAERGRGSYSRTDVAAFDAMLFGRYDSLLEQACISARLPDNKESRSFLVVIAQLCSPTSPKRKIERAAEIVREATDDGLLAGIGIP